MKKLSSFLLAMCMLAAVLAGCSASGQGVSGGTDTSGGASANSAAPGEAVSQELDIAVFEGGNGSEYWYEIVKRFEEANPGVKVNMQISPTIGEIIRPQIVAGQIPDFMYLNIGDPSGLIESMIKDKALLDITDVFDGPALDTEGALRDRILDGVLESTAFSPYDDGRIYSAPADSGPNGLIYNIALFEANGWELPVTWEEFFALGGKAAEQGISLYTYQGIYPSYNSYLLFTALASGLGGDAFNAILNYEEGAFNNPDTLAILQRFKDIAEGGYLLPGTTALNHTQAQSELLMDKALFLPCGTWIVNEMKDAPRTDGFRFGMAPAPVLESGDTRYVGTNVGNFSIPAGAENPALAKAFLRFLYTEDSVKLFAETANSSLAVKGAAETAKDVLSEDVYAMYKIYDEPNVKVLMAPTFNVPKGCKVNVTDEIFNPISDVMNGSMSVEEWAQNVEKAFAQVRADLEAAA